MEYPSLVYRCPGAHQRMGGTYAYLPVQDEDEHAKASADGWFDTLPEAIEAHDNPKAAEPVKAEPADDAPPTRAELELKATELAIKFDGRTSDKKLAAAIAEALKVLT